MPHWLGCVVKQGLCMCAVSSVNSYPSEIAQLIQKTALVRQTIHIFSDRIHYPKGRIGVQCDVSNVSVNLVIILAHSYPCTVVSIILA